jgi:hypothetical protein
MLSSLRSAVVLSLFVMSVDVLVVPMQKILLRARFCFDVIRDQMTSSLRLK